jgi:hypothetical protein
MAHASWVLEAGNDDDLQVWDLLAPEGKQELELVKSIGGFDIPDLTLIGEPWPPILKLHSSLLIKMFKGHGQGMLPPVGIES